MSDKPDNEELTRLVRESLGENTNRPFRPFAVFNESLDSVIVMIRDCSYTEVRINESLAILEDNYPEEQEDRYVGFEIWGVRHFCMTDDVQFSGRTDLVELFDAIIAKYPCPVHYQDEIYRMLIEVDTVELPS